MGTRQTFATTGHPDLNAMGICQPWASLLAIGARAYDVQHQPTLYRGELAIFAKLEFPQWARDLATQREFADVLSAAGLKAWALPRGVFVGVAHLVDVVPITTDNVVAGVRVSALEQRLGDYRAGRWAWRYERIRRLREPIGYRGKAGIFRWRPVQPLVFTERPSDPR